MRFQVKRIQWSGLIISPHQWARRTPDRTRAPVRASRSIRTRGPVDVKPRSITEVFRSYWARCSISWTLWLVSRAITIFSYSSWCRVSGIGHIITFFFKIGTKRWLVVIRGVASFFTTIVWISVMFRCTLFVEIVAIERAFWPYSCDWN